MMRKKQKKNWEKKLRKPQKQNIISRGTHIINKKKFLGNKIKDEKLSHK
jgi:hypothetical protein